MTIPTWSTAFIELDVTLIGILISSFTAVWMILWFTGSKPMRRKDFSTWWQLFGYSILCTLGVLSVYGEQLFDIFSHIEDVWHYPPSHLRISVLYYEVEIAWYIHSLVAQLINHKTKDFYAMAFHHILTPIECYFAFSCGYQAVGLVIMLLHDAADIWLQLAKSFNYAKKEALCTAAFAGFTVSFLVTRLILFPMCPYAYFYKNNNPELKTTCGDLLSYACVVLFFLHCYWFYFLVQALIRFALHGKVDDTRDAQEIQEADKELERRKSPKVGEGEGPAANGPAANGANGKANKKKD
jgi:hypothetical protein